MKKFVCLIGIHKYTLTKDGAIYRNRCVHCGRYENERYADDYWKYMR